MGHIDELRRLRQGPPATDEPPVLVSYLVGAAEPAAVVGRAVDVLVAVLELSGQPWPALDRWRRALPAWFVDGCAPELDADEEDAWLRRWRALDPAARAAAETERGWALGDWLCWLEPAERQWFWWAAVHHAHHSEVVVTVPGWPYADGALRWLLHLAGATSIEIE